MHIPESILPFWNEFQSTVEYDVSEHFYSADHFCDREDLADELANLVRAGIKRATAGLLWSFEAEGLALPKPGDLSVVTNWHGSPVCIVETKSVVIVPFEEVTEEFAAREGEGDKSLRYWREAHWKYFEGECKRLNREPNFRMPIVCEQFEMVYPKLA